MYLYIAVILIGKCEMKCGLYSKMGQLMIEPRAEEITYYVSSIYMYCVYVCVYTLVRSNEVFRAGETFEGKELATFSTSSESPYK